MVLVLYDVYLLLYELLISYDIGEGLGRWDFVV